MSFFRQRRGPWGLSLFFPLVAGAAALVLGGVVMALWNAILPEAVHAGRLSYWQGVGLLALCRVLFGSFGPGRGGRPGGAGWQRHHEGREKWQRMSEEERHQFRQQWQARARAWGRPPQGPPPTA
ncbi:hypothetical protein [Hymenobacter terricola]|uniref:hypothetical protein n=1 Tax=Hymenobacter terricola TaxID=2819236 RepID=UPI001CF3F51E|nr:hypothetical protein [Hymenobacter terricola]